MARGRDGRREGSATGLLSAIAFGCVAGMRTALGPALLAAGARGSQYDPDGDGPRSRPPSRRARDERVWPLLGKAPVRYGLEAFAAVELIADKLPGVPNRIEAGPLAARAVVGAAVGWAVAGRDVRPASAFAGGCAAIVGAFATYRLRRILTEAARLPDPVVAVVEDAAAIALATTMARRAG